MTDPTKLEKTLSLAASGDATARRALGRRYGPLLAGVAAFRCGEILAEKTDLLRLIDEALVSAGPEFPHSGESDAKRDIEVMRVLSRDILRRANDCLRQEIAADSAGGGGLEVTVRVDESEASLAGDIGDDAERVVSFLKSLGQEDRSALVLCTLERFSLAQAATMLKTERTTLEAASARARKAFRSAFDWPLVAVLLGDADEER